MQILKPIRKSFTVNGAISYNDMARCCNIIRLKKRIIEQFPDLRMKEGIFYKVEILFSYEELEARIKDIKQNKKGIPLLLSLYKE